MVKSKTLKDLKNRAKYRIAAPEIKKFNTLVKGHKKILEAIGNL